VVDSVSDPFQQDDRFAHPDPDAPDFEERPGHELMPGTEEWEAHIDEVHRIYLDRRIGTDRETLAYSRDDLQELFLNLHSDVSQLFQTLKPYVNGLCEASEIDREDLEAKAADVFIHLMLIARCEGVRVDIPACARDRLLEQRLAWPGE
jgi:hypothetical protein